MTEPRKNLVIAYSSYYYCSARTVQFSLHIQDLFVSIGFGVITTNILVYRQGMHKQHKGRGGGWGGVNG